MYIDEQHAHIPADAGQQVSESTPDNTLGNGYHPVTTSEHLVSLPDTNWAIWQWAALRGAGFPVSQALQLAMPVCAAAVDLFFDL